MQGLNGKTLVIWKILLKFVNQSKLKNRLDDLSREAPCQRNNTELQ